MYATCVSTYGVSASRVEALRSIPLFAELSDEALERLAEAATEVEVPKGHVLLEAGQEGAGLLVLLEGAAEVQVGDRRLEKHPGEFLGELSLLLDGLRHTARVQATAPVRCLALRRDQFDDLLREQPQIAVAMLPVLARRLAETMQIV